MKRPAPAVRTNLSGRDGDSMSNYTPRIGARAELAKALKLHPARVAAAGIKEGELDALATSGDEAREADRQQNVELAESDVARKERSDSDADIMRRGDALRDRLPAVIQGLERDGHTADAKLLAALSFARFRMREVGPIDPALAEDERVKKLTRVAREDRISRLDGLANLVATLLTRAPMVAELTSRGIDEAALEALRTDADASSRAGKNVQLAAAATERERAAVKTQTAMWSSLRRMIRKAVQGDPALERLYAQC
jgi:hypothetical protein